MDKKTINRLVKKPLYKKTIGNSLLRVKQIRDSSASFIVESRLARMVPGSPINDPDDPVNPLPAILSPHSLGEDGALSEAEGAKAGA